MSGTATLTDVLAAQLARRVGLCSEQQRQHAAAPPSVWEAHTSRPARRVPGLRGVGVDVVDVARLRRLEERRGEALLERLCTPVERRLCTGLSARYRLYCLAGRVAAKEAVKKALGRHGQGLGWRDVTIGRGPAGEPLAILHGPARRAADRARWGAVHLSIAHEAGVAIAVALAVGRPWHGTDSHVAIGTGSREIDGIGIQTGTPGGVRTPMTTHERVIDVLCGAGFAADELAEDRRLSEDLGVDSTELVEIVVALEERFGVRIEAGSEERLATVGDLVSCVRESVAAGAGAGARR